jgi:hypothetical protein
MNPILMCLYNFVLFSIFVDPNRWYIKYQRLLQQRDIMIAVQNVISELFYSFETKQSPLDDLCQSTSSKLNILGKPSVKKSGCDEWCALSAASKDTYLYYLLGDWAQKGSAVHFSVDLFLVLLRKNTRASAGRRPASSTLAPLSQSCVYILM